ncbi:MULTISPECIES: hypothetical protein [unclassified Luteococcus]|uniref:hypothetical protein n=1 Tax=unclassified Luteococcus TaxID=2639923 RepID=UPI00313A87F3
MPRRWIPLTGCTTIVLLAVWSVVQNLVLNPLATAPGRSLPQIHADITAAGESMDSGLVLAVAGLGVGLAFALLLTGRRRQHANPRAAATGFLVLGVFAAPAHWLASFGPNIALADTYQTSGAAHSPWGWPIYLASGLCLIALILLAHPAREPHAATS